MRGSISYCFAYIFLLSAILLCPSVQAATIEDVIITTRLNDLLVYCTVKGSFTEEMNRAILNGIPTTFTFILELNKQVPLFPDLTVSHVVLHHTIKYSAIKSEFTLEFDKSERTNLIVNDFYEAKKMLTELNGIKLASLLQLDPSKKYYIRIKAKLNKVRLPFYLHYIFFFASLWDFETDWYEVYFNY
jgi:hypothetical protein